MTIMGSEHLSVDPEDTAGENLAELKALNRELMATAPDELDKALGVVARLLGMVRGGIIGPVSEDQRDRLDSARANCSRLQGALDRHRMRASRLRIHRTVCDLYSVLDNIARCLAGQLRQRARILAIERPAKPATVFCDGQRIGQVICNLLERVIDSAPAGETIVLKATATDDEIQITVHQQSDLSGPALVPGVHYGSRGWGKSSLSADRGTVARRIIELHGGALDPLGGSGNTTGFHFVIPRLDDRQGLTAVLRDRLTGVGSFFQPLTFALLEVVGAPFGSTSGLWSEGEFASLMKNLPWCDDDDVLYFPERRWLAVISTAGEQRTGELLADLVSALAPELDLSRPIKAALMAVTPSIEAEDWVEIALTHQKPVRATDLIEGRFAAEPAG